MIYILQRCFAKKIYPKDIWKKFKNLEKQYGKGKYKIWENKTDNTYGVITNKEFKKRTGKGNSTNTNTSSTNTSTNSSSTNTNTNSRKGGGGGSSSDMMDMDWLPKVTLGTLVPIGGGIAYYKHKINKLNNK